ncbi:MAG TPA: type II toxin-antitoxin system VapC family toxin [Candidatus Acidoferrum sp.]|nr:type II toxin-antitoxin system VapC family toxin [Candidatus Acidoferrum sp.]
MKGIDTNILVRYLIHDDLQQLRAASRFIEDGCSEQEPGFVNQIVLAELVWVLERGYKLDRSAVAAALEALLLARQLSIEHPDDVRTAISDYLNGTDFADSLIAAWNSRFGCAYTATFDRRAARNSGFRLIK